MIKTALYLDYSAGEPLKPAVKQAIADFDLWANPQSVHRYGRESARIIRATRDALAEHCRCMPEHLSVTESGSASNRRVIQKAFHPGAHWIVSQGEHSSTLQMIPWWEQQGGTVSTVQLQADGSLANLHALIQPQTRLVSAMLVNNETGVILDTQILEELRTRGILVHMDAIAAWGKVAIPWGTADFITLSGHKVGALAGCGLIRSSELFQTVGTPSLLHIVALGAALPTIDSEIFEQKWRPFQEYFEQQLKQQFPRIEIHGATVPRAAHIINILPHHDTLVELLDLEGIAVSSGSACASGTREPSHVLISMGRSIHEASRAVRISYGDGIGMHDITMFLATLGKYE